jgi:hypothetical protein
MLQRSLIHINRPVTRSTVHTSVAKSRKFQGPRDSRNLRMSPLGRFRSLAAQHDRVALRWAEIGHRRPFIRKERPGARPDMRLFRRSGNVWNSFH